MKFLVDSQLPERITLQLQEIGLDAIHVSYLNNGDKTTDTEILKVFTQEMRTLITKDEGFIENFILDQSPQKLLYVNLNVDNKQLLKMIRQHTEYLIDSLESKAFFEIS